MSLVTENPELEPQRSRSGRAERRGDAGRSQRPARSDSYHDLDDEDKLVRLAGTIAAAEAERAALERRIAQKAIVRNLEKRLAEQEESTRRAQHHAQELELAKEESIRAREEDDMRFQHTLSAMQAEGHRLTEALTAKNNEAEAREDEYMQLHEETTNLRDDNESLREENESLQLQLAAQSSAIARSQNLMQQNQNLRDKIESQDIQIRQLNKDIRRNEEMERQMHSIAAAERAANMPRPIAVAPGMYGPVGRPQGGFQDPGFNGFPPPAHFPMGPPPSAPTGPPPSAPMGPPPSGPMMYNTRPMPIMPSVGRSQGRIPPPQSHPYLPGSLSSEHSQQPSSDGGARSEVSGQVPISPGAVSISPRHMMQDEAVKPVSFSEQAVNKPSTNTPVAPSNEPIQIVSEPVQQAVEDGLPESVQQAVEDALPESVQRVPVDGQAFLAKLQRKESDLEGSSMRPHEANGVPAVREPPGLATQAPPPPVQNSRSAPVMNEVSVVDGAPESCRDGDQGQTDVIQPANQAVGSSIPQAAEEEVKMAPPPPADPIYIPAMPQGYLESLPRDQQQKHQNDVNALFNPPAGDDGASDLAGQYVPAMPPGHAHRQVTSVQADSTEPAQRQRNPRNKKKKGRGGQNRGQQGAQGSDRNGSNSQVAENESVSQSAQNQPNEAQRQIGDRRRKPGQGGRRNRSARDVQQA